MAPLLGPHAHCAISANFVQCVPNTLNKAHTYLLPCPSPTLLLLYTKPEIAKPYYCYLNDRYLLKYIIYEIFSTKSPHLTFSLSLPPAYHCPLSLPTFPPVPLLRYPTRPNYPNWLYLRVYDQSPGASRLPQLLDSSTIPCALILLHSDLPHQRLLPELLKCKFPSAFIIHFFGTPAPPPMLPATFLHSYFRQTLSQTDLLHPHHGHLLSNSPFIFAVTNDHLFMFRCLF